MGTRILGDWGSTRLRLWLVRSDAVAERRDGPGIIGLARAPADVLREAIASWREREAIEAITLCGMAGARGGLCEARYAECAVSLADWAQAAARFSLDGIPVRIAAGVAAATQDVMRGEETQVFGSFSLAPGLAAGRNWIVLPGTHSKWVSAHEGSLVTLRTFLTGELFALLRSSSLLAVGGPDDGGVESDEGFAAGVAQAAAMPGLLGSLFTARAAQLRQGRSPDWATGFLSGLLIGSEISDMRAARCLPAAVTMIGDAGLTERYDAALAVFGVACDRLDGDACALAGLRLLDAND